MSWNPSHGVDVFIELHVRVAEMVKLRLNEDGGGRLSIGDDVEIMLQQRHVDTLRGQVLGCDAPELTENAVADVEAACSLVVSSVQYARLQADAAVAAGATQAAALVNTAEQTAIAAMREVANAIHNAGDAAAAAATASGEPQPRKKVGRRLRPV